MNKCETDGCDNIPYSNQEFGIADRFCFECSWKKYTENKPFDHDWGD